MYCRLASKHVDEGGAAVPPSASGSTPAGHDDGLGPILPDLGSLLHADKPNARRFMVTGLALRFDVQMSQLHAPDACCKHPSKSYTWHDWHATICTDADVVLAWF